MTPADGTAKTSPRPRPASILAHHLRENNQLQAEVENLKGELERKSGTIDRLKASCTNSSCTRCPILLHRVKELEELVNEMNKMAGQQMSQGRDTAKRTGDH
ncbi:hypothetical protein Pmar_PMAR015523 [Perkinsus marinus ATCC 50983]|uniref:Uncharacterized protein n=1 Tax=Perkinsus marinus (strain ATCC 50983 / TXsc) TaxID=423536 RepID=C5LNA2_PERM5|nr:hypothetical protein Pmar_PMAR015523 [Perkinsus marinus ATCC 50983]EER01781.1 hypothetical protein Pmar_PMAR015523 [Perkinsus marinus ATCC 50983]|eukprot:XP_002769063.1 hypothetical protein Pmar_PMAR015523 [Perkinsus marinus ATCC 50983]